MAARSINHKFIRLYDQSIPEHHSDYSFVDGTSLGGAFRLTITRLFQWILLPKSTASSSNRPCNSQNSWFKRAQGRIQSVLLFLKPRADGDDLGIVRDLAQRFTDGRITTEKLLQATDEELSEMLIAIYGVGKVCPLQ